MPEPGEETVAEQGNQDMHRKQGVLIEKSWSGLYRNVLGRYSHNKVNNCKLYNKCFF